MTDDDVVILTVRIVRSFEHRNIKHMVLKGIDISKPVTEFLLELLQELKTRPGIPPPFKNFQYDTLKIQHQPHGFKTNDPVINKDNDDELILKLDKSLKECGVVNETEISLFKMSDYLQYKKNPTSNCF